MKLRLINYLWLSGNEIRDKEVLDSINFNIESNLFDEILIFTEQTSKLDIKIQRNVTLTNITLRPTFQYLFDYVNAFPQNNYVNILSNSDILFNESILLAKNMDSNDFYCITRHELDGNLFSDSRIDDSKFKASQDVWIWKGDCKLYDCDFYLGFPGCDNALACKAKHIGYKVKNPCLSIKVTHNHKSDIRSGDSNLSNYKNHLNIMFFISPTHLDEPTYCAYYNEPSKEYYILD